MHCNQYEGSSTMHVTKKMQSFTISQEDHSKISSMINLKIQKQNINTLNLKVHLLASRQDAADAFLPRLKI